MTHENKPMGPRFSGAHWIRRFVGAIPQAESRDSSVESRPRSGILLNVLLRLLLLFTVVPLVELFLLIRIGEAIGLVRTVAIVLGTGILGAWLTRLQGLRVLARIRSDLAAGRMPTDSLIDGLLILVAGLVLITPGLLTDMTGFFLLVPTSRAWLRRRIAAAFRAQIQIGRPGEQPPEQPVVIDAEWVHED